MKSSTQARFVGASMVFAFILICITIFPIDHAFAAGVGPEIFDVRRSLPLEPDEPVTKDFYINVGPESGLKKGVYVTVVRSVPVHDPIKNQQQATLNIPVGKVLVIDVQRGITVARLQSELGDEDRPTLEFEGVMIGDHVDLGSATMDVPKKPKPKAKRQVATVTEEVPVTLTPVVLPPEAPVPSPGQRAAAAAAAAIAPAAPSAQAVAPNQTVTPQGATMLANPPASTSAPTGASAPTQESPKATPPAKSADASDVNLSLNFVAQLDS